MDEAAVVGRAVADAELDEAAERDGVRADAGRGEVGEQRERGREGAIVAEAGEGCEERVRLGVGVEAAATPASCGETLARQAVEQRSHMWQKGSRRETARVPLG